MTITSTAFGHNQPIPSKYTCDGENVNPPLNFSKVPKEAKSLCLIVEDPDAPSGMFTHWLIYNMSPSTLQILDNQIPEDSVLGMTDFGKIMYGGPCPPSGTHRYFFKLFALDTILNIPKGENKEAVEKVMRDHILEKKELIGLYKKI